MAPNTVFLFVNKDSTSPSLSRNTGREAAIASEINKHVQQQRFRKNSVSRKNWYRSFTKSESSSPSTSSSIGTSLDTEDNVMPNKFSQPSPKDSASSPKRIIKPGRRPTAPQGTSRSVPRVAWKTEEETSETNLKRLTPFPPRTIFSRPGDSIDPFSNTVQPITPVLRDVLARHLQWAVSSSISAFAIHEGVRRILSGILTNSMHGAAFLAMATAQQRRTANVSLPESEGVELYRYRATKLIREHIVANGEAIDPYTFVDVFRLAMCEWLNGNHKAARVHFSYIAHVWREFCPQNRGEQHNLEVISSEDMFLAIDMDEKPLLAINWEPEFEPSPIQHDRSPDIMKCIEGGELNLCQARDTQATMELRRWIMEASFLHSIILPCLHSLCSIPDYSTADFASALNGPLWVIKRRMHAAMHRLQTLSGAQLSCTEDVLRRALIILLFLSTTTPARRLARTDFALLALRLQSAMLKVRKQESRTTVASPGFWLWISVAGLVAVQETRLLPDQGSGQSSQLRSWFMARCTQLARCMFEKHTTIEVVRSVLTTYLYFETVQGAAVVDILATMGLEKVP